MGRIELIKTKEIKIFDIGHKKDLSELINEEISNLEEYQTIHDIKYIVSNDGWRYALIIYSKSIERERAPINQRGSYYMDDEAARGTLFEGGIK